MFSQRMSLSSKTETIVISEKVDFMDTFQKILIYGLICFSQMFSFGVVRFFYPRELKQEVCRH